MIWFKDYNIEMVREWMDGNNSLRHLGIEFTELGDDYLRGTMPVDYRTVQPFGILHGGASCMLAETLGSVASGLMIDPDTKFAVGSHIAANHIRRAENGIVTGTARPVHTGRTKHVWDIDIRNEDGKIVAKCELTCVVHDVPEKMLPKT